MPGLSLQDWGGGVGHPVDHIYLVPRLPGGHSLGEGRYLGPGRVCSRYHLAGRQ